MPPSRYKRSKANEGLLLGAFIVLGQRLGLPFGESAIPITLLLIIGWSARGLVSRRASLSGSALLAWLMFVAVAAVSAVLANGQGAILSLLQVAAFWVVLTIRTRQGGDYRGFLLGASCVTVAAAAFGVLQVMISATTRVFLDPLSGFGSVLLTGYNTTYNVGALGTWDKANGGVFLEPSFLSLTCGLVIVLTVQRVVFRGCSTGARTLLLVILVAGLIASTALSGLVLLPALALALVTSLRRLIVVIGAVAAGFLLLPSIPLVQAYALRFTSEGSNDARLVRPYTELVPIVLRESPLWGFGPGSADVAARELTGGTWQAEVTAPTLVKLIFEYGLAGLVPLLILLGLAASRSVLPLPTRLALLLALLVPTNALVNPLLTALILTALVTSSKPIDGGAKTRHHRYQPSFAESIGTR